MPWGTKCTRPVCGGMLLAARPYNHKRRAAERVALVVGGHNTIANSISLDDEPPRPRDRTRESGAMEYTNRHMRMKIIVKARGQCAGDSFSDKYTSS